MKRILVPTDFSPIAENTLNYAIELAGHLSAELMLFHAYYQPVLAYDITVVPLYEGMEEDCRNNLEKLRQRILEKRPDLHVSCECRSGMPTETIDLYAAVHQVDFIVIGTQGTGYVAERLLGNIATALVRKAACPVLVIDGHVHFRQPDKIVLAADYKDIIGEETLKPLKNLITNFDAHLYILHVAPEGTELPDLHELYLKFDLKNAFRHYDHSVISVHDEDVTAGIGNFVELRDARMVAMVPRKHGLWKRIFGEPATKKMAFHSKVPLLVLHNNTL